MRGALGGALVALVLVSAGCGQPAILDADRAEAGIRARMDEAYTVPVLDVACPDRVEVEEGGTFRCQVGTPGGRVDVLVRQTDGDGGLAVEPDQAVLVTAEVAQEVEALLADRFDRDEAAVTCPGPEVRVAEVGSTFSCRAQDAGEVRTVRVRVRDSWGALTYAVDDPEDQAGVTGG